jgi:hypothetical protein
MKSGIAAATSLKLRSLAMTTLQLLLISRFLFALCRFGFLTCSAAIFVILIVNNQCASSCHFERSEVESRNLLFNRFLHFGLLRNPLVEMTKAPISSTIGITHFHFSFSSTRRRRASPPEAGKLTGGRQACVFFAYKF